MKSILDPSFQYTPSVATNVAKTFARVWAELEPGEGAEAVPVTPRYARRAAMRSSAATASIEELIADLRNKLTILVATHNLQQR